MVDKEVFINWAWGNTAMLKINNPISMMFENLVACLAQAVAATMAIRGKTGEIYEAYGG